MSDLSATSRPTTSIPISAETLESLFRLMQLANTDQETALRLAINVAVFHAFVAHESHKAAGVQG